MDAMDTSSTVGGSPASVTAHLFDGISLERTLAGVDINLLVALEALLICRNVTHAARRIGQTQPATSRALARLRDLFEDDLLVRSSTGLKLTAFGEHLADIVPLTMSNLRDVLSLRQPCPSIRLTMNTNLMPAVLPYFMQSSRRGNEKLKVSTHTSPDEGLRQLRTRTAQYMLSSLSSFEPDIEREIVLEEDFVTLVAFDRHRSEHIHLTHDDFLEFTHINLIENGSPIFPQFTETMIGNGVRQSSLFDVPDVTSAGLVVSESALALTVPRSIAAWLLRTLPLHVLAPPLAIPPLEISLCWLADDDVDSADRRRILDSIEAAARGAIARDQAFVRTVTPLARRN